MRAPFVYAGLRIIEDASMVDVIGEDWSKVRSPARARRRRRKGYPQNITPITRPQTHIYKVGADMLVMHPATARKLRAAIEERKP